MSWTKVTNPGSRYGRDAMTTEERAVIEAAENWNGARSQMKDPCTCAFCVTLADAVRALRESRKPKPRWGVGFVTTTGKGPARREDTDWHLSFDGEHLNVHSHNLAAIESLAAALNAEAERAAGEDQ